MLRSSAVAAFLFVFGVPSAFTGQRPEERTPLETIEPGRDTYLFHCAPCHGRGGKGDGPVVPALKAPPPDLTTLATRGGGRFPRAEVSTFVTGRGRASAAHGSSDMPIWGPLFRELNPFDSKIDVRMIRLIDHLESIQMK